MTTKTPMKIESTSEAQNNDRLARGSFMSCMSPNVKLTDDEERATDAPIESKPCPRSSSFGRAPGSAVHPWSIFLKHQVGLA